MLSLQRRLILLQFIEYFIWGSWLISLSGYLYTSIKATNVEISFIYATMGIASVITPPIFGLIADKWIHSEQLLGICRFIGAIALYFASKATSYNQLKFPMIVNALMHMPALSLNYSICYSLLCRYKYNLIEAFPPIRLWGTFGFICAMWMINFLNWTQSSYQLLLASIASLVSCIYAFTLPSSIIQQSTKPNLKNILNLNSLVLLKQKKMILFFCISLLIGVCNQINNTWCSPFLEDFRSIYPNSLTVKYPLFLLSISQISEILIIFIIPLFLKKYGIKRAILLTCCAYMLRFGLFAIGNPQSGFIYLFFSMIMYGIAFNFFNISSSLFIEKESFSSIKSGAQGLLMTTTNGFGAIVGQFFSAYIIDYFTLNGIRNWQSIWFVLTVYSLMIVIIVMFSLKEESIKI